MILQSDVPLTQAFVMRPPDASFVASNVIESLSAFPPITPAILLDSTLAATHRNMRAVTTTRE